MEDGVCLQFLRGPISFFFMCKASNAMICLMPNFKCTLLMPSTPSFNNLQNLCKHDVKMDVEMRNKISAVFYRIF